MQKTIWYGAKDDNVRFANSENELTSQGINNPQSFTVNGEVNGLNLDTENQQHVGASSGSTTQA
jgi:hypothetical protein